jgi:altronate dehydratase small subunit
MNQDNCWSTRLLRLAPQDNVLIALTDLKPGEVLTWENLTVRIKSPIPLGHKLAARAISARDKVIKYGVPIGTATQPIGAFDHVHTHNLKSDYLPTYVQGQYLHRTADHD